ncbi:peptidoglycan-binding protein [Streptomyces sp. NBC_00829]|uniref:peptidoglycan-binding domain-containing protein n=1 Tax=Streptomyces sp. NBC_00829 TaxID=2903679 RepID=UPI003867E334
MWQLFLQAQGYYDGSIDCDFGPQTTAATAAFQRDFHLEDDGSAGPATLSVADDFLGDEGNNRDIGVYGQVAWIEIFRRVNGVYYGWINGAWRSASYTSSAGCA